MLLECVCIDWHCLFVGISCFVEHFWFSNNKKTRCLKGRCLFVALMPFRMCQGFQVKWCQKMPRFRKDRLEKPSKASGAQRSNYRKCTNFKKSNIQSLEVHLHNLCVDLFVLGKCAVFKRLLLWHEYDQSYFMRLRWTTGKNLEILGGIPRNPSMFLGLDLMLSHNFSELGMELRVHTRVISPCHVAPQHPTVRHAEATTR